METVKMSKQEMEEFEAFRAEKAKKEQAERQKRDREAYKQLIDEQVDKHFPNLQEASQSLRTIKRNIMDSFVGALAMKADLFGVKDDQLSHTFTNSTSTRRISLGYYTTDGYRDTVAEGIAIVKEVVGSMAKDAQSRAMVDAILKLLSKDQKGNLKPSRVIQLRRMAEDLGNNRLLDGVRIIEDSYQPTISKIYVKAEYKNQDGAWENVPLGMTEV